MGFLHTTPRVAEVELVCSGLLVVAELINSKCFSHTHAHIQLHVDGHHHRHTPFSRQQVR
eukprot:14861534-Heterocapsa_arctica.AAC.1